MSQFLEDRELIVALSDADAWEVLRLMDNAGTPAPALAAALRAARRIPDVSHHFLLEKSERHRLSGGGPPGIFSRPA